MSSALARAARIATMVSLLLYAGSSAAAAVSSFYVFGDSLSDGGNAYALAGATFLPPPYAQRFSNGPVAAEYLAANLGLGGFAPSALGGTNYATGGATTGTQNFNFAVGSPPGLPASLATTGMLAQINNFLATVPTPNPDTSLYMVWGGPNDFFLGSALGATPLATATAALNNLATEIGALAALAKAKRVLVPNMPNLGATPAFSGDPVAAAQLNALTVIFNAALAGVMNQVEDALGVDIVLFDTYAFFNDALLNPQAYGFTNTAGRCIDSLAALASDCAGYMFFDGVHPTTAAHHILADRFFAAVSEPSVLAQLALGLALIVVFSRLRCHAARSLHDEGRAGDQRSRSMTRIAFCLPPHGVLLSSAYVARYGGRSCGVSAGTARTSPMKRRIFTLSPVVARQLPPAGNV